MIAENVLRMWDRQRELRQAEREKRARELLDLARRRVAMAMSVMRMT